MSIINPITNLEILIGGTAYKFLSGLNLENLDRDDFYVKKYVIYGQNCKDRYPKQALKKMNIVLEKYKK